MVAASRCCSRCSGMSAVRTVEPDGEPEQLTRARLSTVAGKIRVATLPKHMACLLVGTDGNPPVVGQIDRRHATLAQLTLYGVAAFEGCVQTSDWIRHRVRPESERNDAPILCCVRRIRTRWTVPRIFFCWEIVPAP